MNSPELVNNAKHKMTKIDAININNALNHKFETRVEITINPDEAVKVNPYVYVIIKTEAYPDIEQHVKGCEVDVVIESILSVFDVTGDI